MITQHWLDGYKQTTSKLVQLLQTVLYILSLQVSHVLVATAYNTEHEIR